MLKKIGQISVHAFHISHKTAIPTSQKRMKTYGQMDF